MFMLILLGTTSSSPPPKGSEASLGPFEEGWRVGRPRLDSPCYERATPSWWIARHNKD